MWLHSLSSLSFYLSPPSCCCGCSLLTSLHVLDYILPYHNTICKLPVKLLLLIKKPCNLHCKNFTDVSLSMQALYHPDMYPDCFLSADSVSDWLSALLSISSGTNVPFLINFFYDCQTGLQLVLLFWIFLTLLSIHGLCCQHFHLSNLHLTIQPESGSIFRKNTIFHP